MAGLVKKKLESMGHFRSEQVEECKLMAENNYERTHCSKCGEWLEIERQEVCGECGKMSK
jgi:hypothetical protein